MAKPVIEPIDDYVASYKQWSLDSRLSVQNISHALKRKVRQQKREDSKVKHRWVFTVDGDECAIWDYYGTKWSAYGPRAAFAKLGLTVYPS